MLFKANSQKNRGLHKIFQKQIFFFVCVEEAKTFAMKLKTSESTYR